MSSVTLPLYNDFDNSKNDEWVILRRESLYFPYYSLFKDDDYHQENQQNPDIPDQILDSMLAIFIL